MRKNILFGVIAGTAFLLIANVCFAQKTYKVGGDTPHITSSVDTLKQVQQYQFPKPLGYVNDYEGDLDSATIKTLARIASAHRKKTKEEIVVVTIPTFAPFKDLSAYVKGLSDAWGIGEKGKNDGVLVVFSKTQRQVRIGVGKGLYKKLTDAMSQKVMDDKMLPLFKQKKFSEGLLNGTEELVRLLEQT
jgi:uncharacterized protein